MPTTPEQIAALSPEARASYQRQLDKLSREVDGAGPTTAAEFREQQRADAAEGAAAVQWMAETFPEPEAPTMRDVLADIAARLDGINAKLDGAVAIVVAAVAKADGRISREDPAD